MKKIHDVIFDSRIIKGFIFVSSTQFSCIILAAARPDELSHC